MMFARTALRSARSVLLLLSTAIVVPADSAADPPAILPSDLGDIPTTLATDPLQRLSLGKLSAKFEVTTLAELLAALGAGWISHSGDAGESRYWLCYSLPGQRIWLVSHGEMGGESHRLTEVAAKSVTADSASDADCPELPQDYRPVRFGFGWLGSNRDALERELGTPSATASGWIAFRYDGKLRGHSSRKPGELEMAAEFDVSAIVAALIRDGRVVELRSSHVTSN